MLSETKSRFAGKNLSLLFSAFLLFQITLLAQAPDILWTKTFGGTGYDEGTVVIETNDNGYVVGGGKEGWSYIIRINQNGDTLWTKSIRYPDNSYEYVGPNIYELNSGDYVMGFAGRWAGVLWLINNGDSIQYSWHFVAMRQGPYMSHLCKTQDGNYILSYYRRGGFSWNGGIKKVDSLGNEIWDKERNYVIQYVIQTNDSGYAFTGIMWGGNLPLDKTDIYGDIVWTREYQDTIALGGVCLEQISDGGYMILGNDEYYYLRLFRTNELGDSLWTKAYGGSENDIGEFFTKTPDGGYIIVGSTESIGAGGSDVWLIKIDSLGNTQWTKTIGGVEDDYGKYVQVTSDGGYIVTGSTYSYGQGESDVWVIKLAPDPLLDIEPNNNIVISDYKLAQNFPNPFNPVTTISYSIPIVSQVELVIYNTLGEKIKKLVNEEQDTGFYNVNFNAERLASGIYLYRIQAGDYFETKKMILLK